METQIPQEQAPAKKMTGILIGAVLLAAVVVAIIMYSMPKGGGQDDFTGNVSVQENSQTMISSSDFSTGVLQRPDYVYLDASLFSRGLLPVQPPATAGKPNPFQ